MTTTESTGYRPTGEQEAVIVREFAAPRELVWAAHTRPEHVQEWLLGPEGWSMPVCEIDLRPGGAWRFVWRRADGTELAMTGEYLEVDAPARLVNTESWGPEWPATVNTVELTEIPGGTRLVATMRFPDAAARDAALQTGMDGGVERSYARLAALLARIS